MPGILIVDDEEDIQRLVRAVIVMANEGLEVIGEAATGEEAVDRCRELQRDVVVLDHRLPDISGIEAAERMLADRPNQRIILFSAFLDKDTVSEAARAGIGSCLDKGRLDSLPEELWKSVAR